MGSKADHREILRSLELIVDGDSVAELRVPAAGRAGTISGYFTDMTAMAAEATRLSGRAAGVYVTLNSVNPALLARAANKTKERARHTTSDKDILRRHWLQIDIDPARPAGISSTESEHDSALGVGTQVCEFLTKELGVLLDALVLIDSGNGANVLVRVDLPNDREADVLVSRCLAALYCCSRMTA